MKAVRVKVNEAEAARKELVSGKSLDKTRKLVRRKDFIEIPVIDSFEDNDLEVIVQEEPEYYIQEKNLTDIVNIPDNEKRLLPSGWQVLGDIILVSLHPGLEKYSSEIGNALLALYPACRTVLKDSGIKDRIRQPSREVIAGNKETITLHKENGCYFKLDAMQLMYSKGNLAEKKRMSKLGKGETIIDMFAGIGYFSIPMAVHSGPEKILAIEINPVAFEYLKKNIILNKVEDIIEPVLGDCSTVTPRGVADRVIMGYLTASEYLEKGIRALLPGGILHYHEAVPGAVIHRPADRIIAAAGEQGHSAEILELRKIKKYSPGVWHVVVDARLD